MARLTFLLVLLSFAAAASPGEEPIDVPISGNPSRFRIVGRLGEPFGVVVAVQGFIVENPSKGDEGGPNLRVQRINGRATQKHIQIRLPRPVAGAKQQAASELPAVTTGKSYEIEGYETGEFVGLPDEALRRLQYSVQTAGFYFHHRFVPLNHNIIDPIAWSPADFVDRSALLAGQAVTENNRAYIASADWGLLVDAQAPWPEHMLGKAVEGRGVVRKTRAAATYRLENGTTSLVRLRDQVGRHVSLRGTARSMNGDWWFHYRGTNLHVENMQNLPKWSGELHHAPIQFDGVLEEVPLPAMDQPGIATPPNLKIQFIVRKPSWKPIDGLLSPEIVDR